MQSSFRRALVAFFTVLSFLFVGAMQAAPAQAAIDKKVIIHYHRYAADSYGPWKLWLWPHTDDKHTLPGADYTFNGTDAFGVSATYTVPNSSGYAKVGFIVKKGDWLAKDTDADRFIDEWSANEAEIWLVEGDPVIHWTKPDLTPKIRSAELQDFTHMRVLLSTNIDLTGTGAEGFTLSDGTNNIPITAVTPINGSTASNNYFNITLGSEVQLGVDYTLSHAGYADQVVSPGNIMNSTQFNDRFYYSGNDLGNTYSADSTQFKVWAPTATKVELLTYANASTADANATAVDMVKGDKGVWSYTLSGDQHLTIYNYRVTVGGNINVAVDPYVRSVTVNGNKGVVLDLSKTDPDGFDDETKPAFSGKATDAIIYELHVRDLSMDANSGVSTANKGKFLAFTETNTKTPDGKTATGVAAIKDLGVTHVELLPVFDFATVDETDTSNTSFNWGYDPKNYNAPEGSYSSDATNPIARVKELKQAIAAMHSQGLRVNMDVVYNHVSSASAFSWQKIVPGYFFRYAANGALANGSGCGNEVASDHAMVSKFITDSVAYWASEYHFDGFRFDLMGLHDVTTMNNTRAALDAIDPTIIMIGEGWNMGDVLDSAQRANQTNAYKMPRIGHFNDGIRDGIKGSWSSAGDPGYAQGSVGKQDAVKAGIVANTSYGAGLGGAWGTIQPDQSVTYVENHDNYTLYDRLQVSLVGKPVSQKTAVFGLASSIALLAQGVPFLHAGQEFMRSKNGNGNSYNAGDAVNSLKWANRTTNAKMVTYFKGLIAMKKAHPAFRMDTAAAIKANLKFKSQSKFVTSYSLNGSAVGDSWATIFVVHNPSRSAVTVNLPAKGTWKIMAQSLTVKAQTPIKTLKKATKASVPAQSTMILVK